jgi:hypothetical protein
MIKALFYAVVSTFLFYLMDSYLISFYFQVYPTVYDLLATAFAYYACLLTFYNINYLILYLCKTYSLFI